MKSIIILGRQPAIGLAELESLYGADVLKPLGTTSALLNLPPSDINFNRLGGALKLGQIISQTTKNNLKNDLAKFVKQVDLPDGSKITLGLSAYGLSLSADYLQSLALTLKKVIRQSGHNVRVVPNRDINLNTAQVLHNKLASPSGIELLLIGSGEDILVARTTDVQDITDYTARDRMRPKRDAKVGMLPPKLAQIIINLASSDINPQDTTILDPFCGTGVLLQEALLMGFDVIGTDLDPRMAEYSKTNIEWLKERWQDAAGDVELSVANARNHHWQDSFDAIASETYLGDPLFNIPGDDKLQELVNKVNLLHKEFLQNIHKQLPAGTRLGLAVPAWFAKGQFLHLPILDQLAKLGYNRVAFKHAKDQDLIYHRPDQLVARELVILTRN